MGKFKVGDRVRATVDSAYSVRKGDIYTVTEILDEQTIRFQKSDGTVDGWCSKNFELVEQPWQPKVGDRVRLVKDGKSTTGAVGKTATLVAWDSGQFIDNDEYLLDIDPPLDYQTLAVTPNYTRAKIDCFEPLPVAEQPAAPAEHKIGDRVNWTRKRGEFDGSIIEAADSLFDFVIRATNGNFNYVWAHELEPADKLTIEAGKFYRTRDGRKVGPARYYGFNDGYPFEVEFGYWVSDSGQAQPSSSGPDLVAEWVDEPAVAVAATASNDNFLDSLIGKTFTAKVKSRVDPAIVCLIEDGQPRPSAAPHVHATEEAASKEAARLAGIHKGQQFGVYVLTQTVSEEATYKHEWQRLAAKGEKINAIRELRSIASLDLRSAKEAVERFVDKAA